MVYWCSGSTSSFLFNHCFDPDFLIGFKCITSLNKSISPSDALQWEMLKFATRFNKFYILVQLLLTWNRNQLRVRNLSTLPVTRSKTFSKAIALSAWTNNIFIAVTEKQFMSKFLLIWKIIFQSLKDSENLSIQVYFR